MVMIDLFLFALFPIFIALLFVKRPKLVLYFYLILSPFCLLIRFLINPDLVFLAVWQNVFLLTCAFIAFISFARGSVNGFSCNIIDLFIAMSALYGLWLIVLSLLNGYELVFVIKSFRDYYIITIFTMLCIKYFDRSDIDCLVKTMAIIAVIASLFTLIEAIYINSVHSVDKLFWITRLYQDHDETTSTYLTGEGMGEFGYYIRPFGIMLQPQISSLFLLFAIILWGYCIKLNNSLYYRSVYYMLTISLFVSFGRTAILIYILMLPFMFNLKKSVIIISVIIGLTIAVAAPFINFFLSFFDKDSIYTLAIVRDVLLYLDSNNLLTFIAGNGFIPFGQHDLLNGEIALLKILLNIGILGLFIYLMPVIYLFFSYAHNNNFLSYNDRILLKYFAILIICFWLSTIHYNTILTNGINTYYALTIAIFYIILRDKRKDIIFLHNKTR